MLAKNGSRFFAKFNSCEASENKAINSLACEQAHRGALVAGREKEGELATTSLVTGGRDQSINIAVTTDDSEAVEAIKDGFLQVFEHVVIQPHSTPKKSMRNADWQR